MPDFGKMRTVAGQAKKPPVLPIGDYPGIIKSFEMAKAKTGTEILRFHVGLMGWPVGAEPIEGIDLSKRQMRKDYYLTDDALWRTDEFFRAMGVVFDGVKTYEELAPSLVGGNVLAAVQQYLNETTGEPGNNIDKLVAAS